MKKRKPPRRGSADLRSRAKSQLADRPRARKRTASPSEVKRILEELQVHQVELEMQNEELRNSRREAEAASAHYSELFDFAPIGYAVLSADETVVAVNHAGAQLLGRPRSMLLKRPFGIRVAMHDRPAFAALLQLVRSGATKPRCEVELNGVPERKTIVRLTGSMLAQPEPALLLAFADITAERQKASELEMAERALREEHVRKDEFLAMLSHELRNPLTPIRSSLAVLQSVPGDSEPARQARDVIERQTSHLTRIVDDLLDITRIARGKMLLKKTRIELGRLVADVVADHRSEFEQHGVRLDLHADSGPFWVEADGTRLVQVIANLLSNARKFTPRDKRVDVRLWGDGERVGLRVSDTGAGIAPDMLGRVFEPFHQAPQKIDRSAGGLGLGLAMVKGLVELHDGSVAIASSGLGRGTEVTVRLPLVQVRHEIASRPAPARHPHQRRRIVLIDDHRDIADGLQMFLGLRGHEVRVAYDGHSGLELVRVSRPDVVICDLGLPGIDGYSLATILRSDKTLGPLCLIALSGYALPDDLRRAAVAGFDRHVAKPPDLEDLARLVDEAPHTDVSPDLPDRP